MKVFNSKTLTSIFFRNDPIIKPKPKADTKEAFSRSEVKRRPIHRCKIPQVSSVAGRSFTNIRDQGAACSALQRAKEIGIQTSIEISPLAAKCISAVDTVPQLPEANQNQPDLMQSPFNDLTKLKSQGAIPKRYDCSVNFPQQVSSTSTSTSTTSSSTSLTEPEKSSAPIDKKKLLTNIDIGTLGKAQLNQVITDVKLACFPYHLFGIPNNYFAAKNIIKSVADSLHLPYGRTTNASSKSRYTQEEIDIRDPQTGLVFSVISDPQRTTLYLIFGGTGSGQLNPESPDLKSSINRELIKQQHKANISNLTELQSPLLYQQAVSVTRTLMTEMTNSHDYKDAQLVLTGHSLGGALAMHSAAMCSTPSLPIKASCFSSPKLGGGCMDDILKKHESQEPLEKACANICDYSVKGDPLANIGAIGAHSGKIGNQVTIPFDLKTFMASGIKGLHTECKSYLDAYFDKKFS